MENGPTIEKQPDQIEENESQIRPIHKQWEADPVVSYAVCGNVDVQWSRSHSIRPKKSGQVECEEKKVTITSITTLDNLHAIHETHYK